MRRASMLLAAGVAAVLAVAGCGSTGEITTASHAEPQPAISRGHAEAIWLHIFEGLLVPGEGQTLHTRGVEQHCEAKGGVWECKGVIPEEDTPFPAKATDCLVVQATIDGTGKVTEESAEPLSKVREATHTEVECRL